MNVQPKVPNPVPSAAMLEEIVGHLGAAVTQMAPTDDPIICQHVRTAHELARILWRANR